MGHLHNLNHKNPSMLSNIGNKIKNVIEFGTMAKGIYDTGKNLYYGARVIAPIIGRGLQYVGPAAAALL